MLEIDKKVRDAWNDDFDYLSVFPTLLSYDKISYTGYSDWKMTKVKGCSSEMVHIWPYVGKAKMCLRDGNLFEKL